MIMNPMTEFVDVFTQIVLEDLPVHNYGPTVLVLLNNREAMTVNYVQ